MHDNLRLQRLVQQLANEVRKLMEKQGATDTEPHESHQQVMALAEATFKEMSLQVNTAVPHQMQRHAIHLQSQLLQLYSQSHPCNMLLPCNMLTTQLHSDVQDRWCCTNNYTNYAS